MAYEEIRTVEKKEKQARAVAAKTTGWLHLAGQTKGPALHRHYETWGEDWQEVRC